MTTDRHQQIGDLLAEITGEKSAPSPSATTSRTATTTGVKRKAESDSASDGIASKTVKQSHLGSRDPATRKPSPLPTRPVAVAKPAISSTNGQRLGTSTSTLIPANKPYTGTATIGRIVRKPEPLAAAASKRATNESSVRAGMKSVTLNPMKVGPTKPSPTTPTSTVPSKAPKKGSFAEIMARGAKAQQIAPKAGTIQHKAIGQTVISKKEREEQKSKWKHGKATGEGKSSSVPPRDRSVPGARNGLTKDGRPGSAGNAAPEKKIKKAAMASTGYTGTARPSAKKPSDSKTAKPASAHGRPAGGLLAMPRTGRGDRYNNEDSDMDDFIDDDEDEDEVAPRGYRYADEYDSESDMEANADDIYAEEQRALRQAREDDAKEEALLEKLKREKEAKKRRGGF